MKVLLLASVHIESGYGTEIVAHRLARILNSWGVEVRIAGHTAGGTGAARLAGAVPLYALPALPEASRESLFAFYSLDAPGFQALLDDFRPDVTQVFGLNAKSANRRHIELAKAAGSKVALWHNVPRFTCLQTELLFAGTTPCDGTIEVQRCTNCRLRFAGVPRAVSSLFSRVSFVRALPVLNDRLEPLVRARRFTARHKCAVAEAARDLDAIQVGAVWARDVLLRNGIPKEKVHLIRPGASLEQQEMSLDASGLWRGDGPNRPMRLIYWGRIHHTKGVHTVVEALALRPELSVEFSIFGNVPPNEDYARMLKAQASRDKRISFKGRIAPEHVLATLRTADLAIIPSRWYETGPLTVFEAHAAGLPILGADRGGVSELCRGPGARLFPPEDAASLADVLSGVVRDRSLLEEMKRHIPKARTMHDTAREMHQLYSQLLGRGVERFAEH